MSGFLSTYGWKSAYSTLALEAEQALVKPSGQAHGAINFEQEVFGDIRLICFVKLTFLIQYRKMFNFVWNIYHFSRHANGSLLKRRGRMKKLIIIGWVPSNRIR
jgi:hypothetical protein